MALDIQGSLLEAGATSFAFASTEGEAIDEAFRRRPLVMTSDVRLLTGTGPVAVKVIRDRLGMIPVLFISSTPSDCSPRIPGDLVFGKPFDRVEIARAFRAIRGGSVLPDSPQTAAGASLRTSKLETDG